MVFSGDAGPGERLLKHRFYGEPRLHRRVGHQGIAGGSLLGKAFATDQRTNQPDRRVDLRSRTGDPVSLRHEQGGSPSASGQRRHTPAAVGICRGQRPEPAGPGKHREPTGEEEPVQLIQLDRLPFDRAALLQLAPEL